MSTGLGGDQHFKAHVFTENEKREDALSQAQSLKHHQKVCSSALYSLQLIKDRQEEGRVRTTPWPIVQRVPQLELTFDAQFTIKFESNSMVIFTCFFQCLAMFLWCC